MNRSAIKISYRIRLPGRNSVSRTSNKKLTPNEKVKPRDNCTSNRMSQQSHDRLLLPFYYSSVPRQFYRTSIRPPSLSFVPSDSARYETNEKHLSLFCSPSFPSSRSLFFPSYTRHGRASSVSPFLLFSPCRLFSCTRLLEHD